jgi:glucose-6-phosphate isomerase
MSQESLFHVSLELALEGKGAIARPAYDAALKEADGALNWLKQQKLELFSIASRNDDLAAAAALVPAFREGATDIAVLGIGGSSLGGQALKALAPHASPRVVFFDNPDPFSWADVLSHFDLKKTRFIVISKSGGTAETMMQALTALDAVEKAGCDPAKHFIVITEPHDSPLKKFADGIKAPVLDHPTGIGGRYSVLSVVGMLPSMLMGLDVKALRAGAQNAQDHVLKAPTAAYAPAAMGAALHHAMGSTLRETVLWAYADKLAVFGGWFRQLWAESLGKDGKGSTPVAAVGPVDQHSQLQLFRDGPHGKLFTILSTDTKGEGLVANPARANALGLGYLAGKPMGDLVDAEARATAQTLSRNGHPVRQIHVTRVDEKSVGALMMHFMLETILMGRLMGVDPFDQPGVEEGKVLARQYLSENA